MVVEGDDPAGKSSGFHDLRCRAGTERKRKVIVRALPLSGDDPEHALSLLHIVEPQAALTIRFETESHDARRALADELPGPDAGKIIGMIEPTMPIRIPIPRGRYQEDEQEIAHAPPR